MRHIYLLNKLGIDALCIIQDDEQDKLREIRSMNNMYRNAVLTLAVDSASSVQDGFLTSRPEFAPKSVSIAYNNETDGKTRSGRLTLRNPLAERLELSALDKEGGFCKNIFCLPALYTLESNIFFGTARRPVFRKATRLANMTVCSGLART
jgi:hypothetical protein